MAWIESHQAIGSHPKTILLAQTLKVKLPTAVGYLHYLWWWALDYAQDGEIGRFGAKIIALACHWTSRPQTFLDALVTAGFVDQVGDGLSIHDWQEYAGGLLERRLRDRDRKRSFRGTSGGPDADSPADRTRTSNGHPPDVPRNSGAPAREGARNRTNQPDQPTGLVRSGESLARARDPDAAERRAAPQAETAVDDEPERLPNGAQKCPLCPQVFTGSYADHLATASTHKIRPEPEDFKKPSSSKRRTLDQVSEAEIAAELAAIAQRPSVAPSAEVLAEHERLLARERQGKQPEA